MTTRSANITSFAVMSAMAAGVAAAGLGFGSGRSRWDGLCVAMTQGESGGTQIDEDVQSGVIAGWLDGQGKPEFESLGVTGSYLAAKWMLRRPARPAANVGDSLCRARLHVCRARRLHMDKKEYPRQCQFTTCCALGHRRTRLFHSKQFDARLRTWTSTAQTSLRPEVSSAWPRLS
jgi:hypothetical protein